MVRPPCCSEGRATSPSPTSPPRPARCSCTERRSTPRAPTRRSPRLAGPVPGAGAFVAALHYATGVLAKTAGKPSPAMFEEARAALGPGRYLVVGDRLDSDIAGGAAAGMQTALVLTGVTTPRRPGRRGRAPRRTTSSRGPRDVVPLVLGTISRRRPERPVGSHQPVARLGVAPGDAEVLRRPLERARDARGRRLRLGREHAAPRPPSRTASPSRCR